MRKQHIADAMTANNAVASSYEAASGSDVMSCFVKPATGEFTSHHITAFSQQQQQQQQSIDGSVNFKHDRQPNGLHSRRSAHSMPIAPPPMYANSLRQAAEFISPQFPLRTTQLHILHPGDEPDSLQFCDDNNNTAGVGTVDGAGNTATDMSRCVIVSSLVEPYVHNSSSATCTAALPAQLALPPAMAREAAAPTATPASAIWQPLTLFDDVPSMSAPVLSHAEKKSTSHTTPEGRTSCAQAAAWLAPSSTHVPYSTPSQQRQQSMGYYVCTPIDRVMLSQPESAAASATSVYLAKPLDPASAAHHDSNTSTDHKSADSRMSSVHMCQQTQPASAFHQSHNEFHTQLLEARVDSQHVHPRQQAASPLWNLCNGNVSTTQNSYDDNVSSITNHTMMGYSCGSTNFTQSEIQHARQAQQQQSIAGCMPGAVQSMLLQPAVAPPTTPPEQLLYHPYPSMAGSAAGCHYVVQMAFPASYPSQITSFSYPHAIDATTAFTTPNGLSSNLTCAPPSAGAPSLSSTGYKSAVYTALPVGMNSVSMTNRSPYEFATPVLSNARIFAAPSLPGSCEQAVLPSESTRTATPQQASSTANPTLSVGQPAAQAGLSVQYSRSRSGNRSDVCHSSAHRSSHRCHSLASSHGRAGSKEHLRGCAPQAMTVVSEKEQDWATTAFVLAEKSEHRACDGVTSVRSFHAQEPVGELILKGSALIPSVPALALPYPREGRLPLGARSEVDHMAMSKAKTIENTILSMLCAT